MFRFLGRLCASGAEELELCSKEIVVAASLEDNPRALGAPVSPLKTARLRTRQRLSSHSWHLLALYATRRSLALDDQGLNHDTALAALHRALSGLNGSPFQRVDGLLDSLLSSDVVGASFAA
jgi:hypothetical protein